MRFDEAEVRRVYHETRCDQEKRRVSEAKCSHSAEAHARLYNLHRRMSIDLALPKPTGAARAVRRVRAALKAWRSAV